MNFLVDWRGIPSAQRLDAALFPRLQKLFAKQIPKSKGKLVHVTFVEEEEMQDMNHLYRGIAAPTDVLAFATEDENERFPGEEKVAGDMYLCRPYIVRSAKKHSVPLQEEMVRLLIHGGLHCLGYDHMTELEKKRMFPLQEAILTKALPGVEILGSAEFCL